MLIAVIYNAKTKTLRTVRYPEQTQRKGRTIPLAQPIILPRCQ